MITDARAAELQALVSLAGGRRSVLERDEAEDLARYRLLRGIGRDPERLHAALLVLEHMMRVPKSSSDLVGELRALIDDVQEDSRLALLAALTARADSLERAELDRACSALAGGDKLVLSATGTPPEPAARGSVLFYRDGKLHFG